MLDNDRPQLPQLISVALPNRMQEKLARGEVALCMATRLARTRRDRHDRRGLRLRRLLHRHGALPITLDAAAQICTAALPVGMTPLVRIAGHDFDDATRLLDMGALGIICPNGRRAGGAGLRGRLPLSAVRHALGRRTRPAAGLPPDALGDVNAQGNAATPLIPMIETPEGVANADAIAAVPGIDSC